MKYIISSIEGKNKVLIHLYSSSLSYLTVTVEPDLFFIISFSGKRNKKIEDYNQRIKWIFSHK